jgi:hypothetical protein
LPLILILFPPSRLPGKKNLKLLWHPKILNAIQVGLPTGARPNSYSEHGEFLLSNSHLRVSYSREHYKFANETGTAVVPEIIIKQSWAEFMNGKDPCLDWILKN